MRTPLALAVLIALAGPAAADSFPRAVQGLWAESPTTCELLRNPGAMRPTDRSWLSIDGTRMTGTTAGTFLRSRGARVAEATDPTLPDVPIELVAERDGTLRERVKGARASMLYIRCR